MGEKIASVDKDLEPGSKTMKRFKSRYHTSFNEETFKM